MTRTEEREQAFVLIFEKEFNMDTSMDDIISYAAEADVFSESAFASSLAKAVFENIETSQNNSRHTSSCHMRDDVC